MECVCNATHNRRKSETTLNLRLNNHRTGLNKQNSFYCIYVYYVYNICIYIVYIDIYYMLYIYIYRYILYVIYIS